jgi:hypothetical protein
MGFFYSADNSGITLGSKRAGLGIVYDLEDDLEDALRFNTPLNIHSFFENKSR